MNRSQENADPSAYIDEFDIQAIVKVSFEWKTVEILTRISKIYKGASLGRITVVIQLYVK